MKSMVFLLCLLAAVTLDAAPMAFKVSKKTSFTNAITAQTSKPGPKNDQLANIEKNVASKNEQLINQPRTNQLTKNAPSNQPPPKNPSMQLSIPPLRRFDQPPKMHPNPPLRAYHEPNQPEEEQLPLSAIYEEDPLPEFPLLSLIDQGLSFFGMNRVFFPKIPKVNLDATWPAKLMKASTIEEMLQYWPTDLLGVLRKDQHWHAEWLKIYLTRVKDRARSKFQKAKSNGYSMSPRYIPRGELLLQNPNPMAKPIKVLNDVAVDEDQNVWQIRQQRPLIRDYLGMSSRVH
jgi:hypothetical protein